MNKEDILNFIEEKVEEKVERNHLSNEQIEKEEWELIAIDVHPQDKRCGIVDVRLAYVDDIRDIYTIRSSGNLHLGKVYPNFIKRKIISRIKEVIGDKKAVVKRDKSTVPTRITIKRPTHITIKRQNND